MLHMDQYCRCMCNEPQGGCGAGGAGVGEMGALSRQ